MMGEHEFVIAMRNLMIAHVMTAAMALPGIACVCRHFIKIWKMLLARIISMRRHPKRDKFWEIDMTKFEP